MPLIHFRQVLSCSSEDKVSLTPRKMFVRKLYRFHGTLISSRLGSLFREPSQTGAVQEMAIIESDRRTYYVYSGIGRSQSRVVD